MAAGNVPGEWYGRTQPIPTKPPAFDQQGAHEDDLIDFTPELRAEAQAIFDTYVSGPIFTPPSLIDDSPGGTKGTVQVPGIVGGADWGGAGVDPETGVLYVPSVKVPTVIGLVRSEHPRSDIDWVMQNLAYPDGPQGLPLFKPPYGSLVAIDLNAGEILWKVPNGSGPRDHPAIQHLNLPPRDAALGVGGSLRDSASRDLAAVFERVRGLGSDDTADPSDEAEVDAAATTNTASRASRPASGGDASADTGGGSGIVAFADLSSTSPDVAGDEPETTEPAVEPLIPAAVFDSRDVNVTPPVTLRLRLPSLGEDDLAQAGVVETIVSASGEVEKVKLVSPPQSVHEAMILSAIKTWRFQPAMKDGQPVRYRHLIPISLPR